MRWSQPHRNWDWDSLEAGIMEFYSVHVGRENLLTYSWGVMKVYCLEHHKLGRIAHLTLAVHQVLEGLYEFLRILFDRRFEIDVGWQLLRFMEENLSRSAIFLSLPAFNGVYGLEGLDVLSSVDSTRSSVRREFGTEPLKIELAKLLARPDYGAHAFNQDARNQLVADNTEGVCTQFYKIDRGLATAATKALPLSPDSVDERRVVTEAISAPVLLKVGVLDANFPPPVMNDKRATLRYPEVPAPLSTIGPVAPQPAFAEGISISELRDARAASAALSATPVANTRAPLAVKPSVSMAAPAQIINRAMPTTTSHWTLYNFPNLPQPSTLNPGAVNNPTPEVKGREVAMGLTEVEAYPSVGSLLLEIQGEITEDPEAEDPEVEGRRWRRTPSGDPEGATDNPCYYGHYDWQLNCKLNFQMVPEWDGHGKTAIPYLCKIAELVRLSPQMIIDLGAIAPLKFTGRAEMWWRTQSNYVRNYLSQSWEFLLRAIQAHFLNSN
ncbi:hypothetical protein C8R43DRAFT_1134900 [Mycena crocata]|nr:hypothetical protein C8R43DRAFT_1134900 [Mycena crocata]